MGDLPWRIVARHEVTKNVMTRVLGAKKAFIVPAAIPNEFRDLLEFARMANLKGDITDNVAEIRVKIKALASNIGERRTIHSTSHSRRQFSLRESWNCMQAPTLVLMGDLVRSQVRNTLIAIGEQTLIVGTREL